jgi:hypothetical protein
MISLLVWLFADLLAAAQEIRRKLSRATSRVLTDLRGDPANQIIHRRRLGVSQHLCRSPTIRRASADHDGDVTQRITM